MNLIQSPLKSVERLNRSYFPSLCLCFVFFIPTHWIMKATRFR